MIKPYQLPFLFQVFIPPLKNTMFKTYRLKILATFFYIFYRLPK
jgi:hypothetical protein